MSSFMTINDVVEKSDNSNSKNLKFIYTDLNKIESRLKEIIPYDTSSYENLSNPDQIQGVMDNELIKETMDTIKERWSEQIKKHRDIHNLISKFGKAAEKSFYEKIDHLNTYFKEDKQPDFNNIYADAINSLIFDYLLRMGLIDVAGVFLEEEKVHLTASDKELLDEVTVVINSMKINEFQPLKSWIQKNKEMLAESQIIEFHYIIYKLEFLCVLSREPDNFVLLIESAKRMALYARFFQPDFEYIMGSLAFIHNPERIRQFYSELFQKLNESSSLLADSGMDCDNFDEDEADDGYDENDGGGGDDLSCMKTSLNDTNSLTTDNITYSLYYRHFLNELIQMFSHQVCSIKQACSSDPLLTLFNSGIRNITEFYNHDQIRKKLYLFNKVSDFPLTVKHHERDLYHSVFHCPVDKTIVSGKNCVLRLKCGHAISKSAFTQLTKNEQKTKMKCPYCPHETKTSDALPLIL